MGLTYPVWKDKYKNILCAFDVVGQNIAEKMYKEAYTKGYSMGYEDGYVKAVEETAPIENDIDEVKKL